LEHQKRQLEENIKMIQEKVKVIEKELEVKKEKKKHESATETLRKQENREA
jgi:hypothetical protein